MERKLKYGLLVMAFAWALNLFAGSAAVAQEAILSDTLRHYILNGWFIRSFTASPSGYAFILERQKRLKLCNVSSSTTTCYALNF